MSLPTLGEFRDNVDSALREEFQRLSRRERFRAALKRRPAEGHIPHFELVTFLSMEMMGRVHPFHRRYHTWQQMTERERSLHRRDMAEIFAAMAYRSNQYAILVYLNEQPFEEVLHVAGEIRELCGDEFFLLCSLDATLPIPMGGNMEELVEKLYERPEELHGELRAELDAVTGRIDALARHGAIDGVVMCSDYCMNSGPFLSPASFSEFVAPYLREQVAACRERGIFAIKHTDGDILPILDDIIAANPDAIHSLDPQAGIDLGEMATRLGGRFALCGNVNCALLQTGTDAEVEEDVRRTLREGRRAPGYVFSTSNCIYTGMALGRYDRMMDVWMREGIGRETADGQA